MPSLDFTIKDKKTADKMAEVLRQLWGEVTVTAEVGHYRIHCEYKK